MAPLKERVEDKISSIDLEFMNPQDGAEKGTVGKDKDLFKKMVYKNGKYVPSDETYIVETANFILQQAASARAVLKLNLRQLPTVP